MYKVSQVEVGDGVVVVLKRRWIFQMDPMILEEYYARKRSVLFSVAQQSEAREPAMALLLSYIVAMLARDGIRIEPAGERKR